MTDPTPARVREFHEALGAYVDAHGHLVHYLRAIVRRAERVFPPDHPMSTTTDHDDPHALTDAAFHLNGFLGQLDADEQQISDALSEEIHDLHRAHAAITTGAWFVGDPNHEAEAGRENTLHLDGTRYQGGPQRAAFKSTLALRELAERCDEIRGYLWSFGAAANRPMAPEDAPRVRGWLYLQSGKVKQRDEAATEDRFAPSEWSEQGPED